VIGGSARAGPCRRVRAADWERHVAGYVLALDMTARDHQARAKAGGLPWTLGKCWDSFAPLSPLVPRRLVRDPHALELTLAVDGAERQRGRTALMLHRIPELIEFASSVMTLERGDVLLTGTPEGVGPVTGGNLITAQLRRAPSGSGEPGALLAELVVPVVDEEGRA